MNYVEDMKRVIWSIADKYPNSPLYAIGHSFGANTLTRYIGICCANKINTRLKAAVSVCTPFDL